MTKPRTKLDTTLPPRPPRPWQRRRPRPYRRELVTLDRAPLAQIDIYDECVVLTRRTVYGGWISYPVSPDAIAQKLGKLPVSTGLLPPGLIASGMRDGTPFYVQYIPAQRVTLQIDDGGRYLSRAIPLPPLIWLGWGREYRIWAVAEAREALSEHTRLMAAPFPNVYGSGGICWGTAGRIEPASPRTLAPMLRLFLQDSRFNGHLDDQKSKRFPASLLRLYEALEREQTTTYPLDDLMAAGRSLHQVISGDVWGVR